MRVLRPWKFLLLLPILAFSFCGFLIATNYYYAQRAAYLLERIRGLPLDNSAVIALKHLGSEHGFRYEEGTNCSPIPCIHMVAPNNLWMQSLLTSAWIPKFGHLLGLKPWLAVGDIEIENQQVIGKIYGLAFFYEQRNDPSIQVTAWEKRKFDLSSCPYYQERHPGYIFRGANNIRSFSAEISSDTSTKNREHAFQFNLRCLTGWHKCDQFSEVMPAAWADHEEDRKWLETHPSSGRCPY